MQTGVSMIVIRPPGVNEQDCQCEPVVGHVQTACPPYLRGRPHRFDAPAVPDGSGLPSSVARLRPYESNPVVDPETTIRPFLTEQRQLDEALGGGRRRARGLDCVEGVLLKSV